MLFVLLLLSNIGSFVAKKLHLPGMIGEIIFGIIAANLVISQLGDWNLLEQIGIIIAGPGEAGSEGYRVLMLLAELGVIFLLFTVGLETKVSDLKKVGKPAIFSAILGMIVPFIAGFAINALFGGDIMASLFIATALMTTSAGIAAHILKKLDVYDSKEGKIILGAAIISEITTLVTFAVMASLSGGDTSTTGVALTLLKALGFVVVAFLIVIFVMPTIHKWIFRNLQDPRSDWATLFIGVAFCFSTALIANQMGLSVIIGAYLAGMMFADKAKDWHMIREVEPLKEFFMSFFFTSVGMRVVMSDLGNMEVLTFAIALSIVAVLSKYIACGIGAKIGDKTLDYTSTNIIGGGMVPKAEVVMVIAATGVMTGVLSSTVFTCIVVTAIVTTMVSHFMAERGFRKKYGEDLSVAVDV